MTFTAGSVLTASALNTFAPSTKITNADGTAGAPSYSFASDNDTGMFRSAADEIGLVTGGTQRLTIQADGDVGIGSTTPQQRLDVAANSPVFRLTDTDTALSNNERSSAIEFFTSDASGTGVAAYIHADGDGSTGNLQLQFGTGAPGAAADRMTIRQTGAVSIAGSLSKGSGSFRIPHPLPSKSATHELVHSFVESPKADNIYRGRISLVGGAASVNLDDAANMTAGTFELLNRDLQCFVVNNAGPTAVRGSVSGSTLTINAQQSSCTDTVDWLVIGERQDQHMYDTEWTDDDGRVIVEPLKTVETDDSSDD